MPVLWLQPLHRCPRFPSHRSQDETLPARRSRTDTRARGLAQRGRQVRPRLRELPRRDRGGGEEPLLRWIAAVPLSGGSRVFLRGGSNKRVRGGPRASGRAVNVWV